MSISQISQIIPIELHRRLLIRALLIESTVWVQMISVHLSFWNTIWNSNGHLQPRVKWWRMKDWRMRCEGKNIMEKQPAFCRFLHVSPRARLHRTAVAMETKMVPRSEGCCRCSGNAVVTNRQRSQISSSQTLNEVFTFHLSYRFDQTVWFDTFSVWFHRTLLLVDAFKLCCIESYCLCACVLLYLWIFMN